MVRISNIITLKSVYYAYFQSSIKYEIIFVGNSSTSEKIFTLQNHQNYGWYTTQILL